MPEKNIEISESARKVVGDSYSYLLLDTTLPTAQDSIQRRDTMDHTPSLGHALVGEQPTDTSLDYEY